MQLLNKNDPKTIGPYTLVARLGSGGMGVVYLATLGSQSVALKVVRATFLDDPSLRRRFAKEVETLRSIQGANIARVIDANTKEDPAWLAVEFVNGPELKALVEDRGPLSEGEWFTLARGLFEGLAAIHKQGVIHRDIKPANILISETGPKIIDFGIAQESDATSMTMTGLVAGSPAWLSPEQLDGTKLTNASDIFSAGAVLNYAASGQSPWGNQNTATTAVVFNKILSHEPDTSKLTPSQREFVEVLLEKDPTKRPTATKALSILEKLNPNKGEVAIETPVASGLTSTRIPRSEKFDSPLTKSRHGKKIIFGLGALLLALVSVGITATNSAVAQTICSTSGYFDNDLRDATLEELEELEFSMVLSRECKSSLIGDEKFKVEVCGSNAAESLNVMTFFGDGASSDVWIPNMSSDRYGCRSWVDLGQASRSESRAKLIGFNREVQIPGFQELGALEAGESRYLVSYDRDFGSFVVKFTGTEADLGAINPSENEFENLDLDIEYVGGILDMELGKEVDNIWWTKSGLAASYSACGDTKYTDQVRKSGKKFFVQTLVNGKMKKIATERSPEDSICTTGTSRRHVSLTVPALTVLTTNKKLNKCYVYEFVNPATADYSIGLEKYCFKLVAK